MELLVLYSAGQFYHHVTDLLSKSLVSKMTFPPKCGMNDKYNKDKSIKTNKLTIFTKRKCFHHLVFSPYCEDCSHDQKSSEIIG